MERRPLNHAVVSSMPRTKAERIAAAAKLAPVPWESPRPSPRASSPALSTAQAILAKDLTSRYPAVRAAAEKTLAAMPLLERQRVRTVAQRAANASLPASKSSSGLTLAEATKRAAKLRKSGKK